MTEIVLPYDEVIAPQEKGWDCGPASTQIVLNSRGIIESEANLIADIGTTTRGTDDVSWVERTMDRRLPAANYTSVYIPRATDDARELLWRNIVQSINARFGVVINWDVPPNNYPRGVKGSQSPAYAGHGEVFHYVAAMGYSDEGGRFVFIADPGFRPFRYWVTLEQLVTMIVPKGYAYANAAPAQPITQPHDDSVEAVMTDNQQRLTEVHDKLLAYPDVPEIAGHWQTRARYAPDPKPKVDDTVGMILYTDANVYDLGEEWAASEGFEPSKRRIAAQAKAHPDDERAVFFAKKYPPK